jgi:DNA-binding NarL/FixJ family response regulator
MILGDDVDLRCNGEAGDGKELMKLLRNRKADVILLDLKMPEMDGMEAIKEIRKLYPHIKVIKTAIYSVYQNEYYFNQLVNNAMLKNYVQSKKVVPKFNNTIKLTEKETEILLLICQEMTAAEIAKQVFLSTRTVEGIRSNLLEKVGVKSTAGLVLYAVKSGLIA